MAAKKVAVVIGYGPGIGASAARKFVTEGFSVAIMSRNLAKLKKGETDIPGCRGFEADVTDAAALTNALSHVESTLGPIDALVYNAGAGVWKTYDNLTTAELDLSMKTNVHGLLTAAQYACPKMQARGAGCVIITGATASLRGKPFTSAFAAAKAAQRSLAQSLARQLGPKYVHVCLAIIDGAVGKGEGRIDPDSIANTYWNLYSQDKSCWTFELDVRPSVENW
ncbi:hypothetical protein CTAYLR_005049 [Chrysophaeum taylorii]|uniref:Uncharacterized protein n=1 Tax=Chrysophaeum taylorii TaxID=2483200 RepID=A0AAD7XIR9_9STRA|nr:hypothetical protein CTAYLR_005049 [Chrysophaeum taylorii]